MSMYKKTDLIAESKRILIESDVNWLLSDYKTNPLNDKFVPFFDAKNPLNWPYIILAEASDDGAAIVLNFKAREDAEAYMKQKGQEGLEFVGPFKLV